MLTNAAFTIGKRTVGAGQPTYFIADIAANHDGQLERAVELIQQAAEAGADAAKFQHFRAGKIVSRAGFESIGTKASHQAGWKKSVYEVYQDASVPWDWTDKLVSACRKAGVDFLSTPYDIEAIDFLAPHMPAFKIGSGDITWLEEIEYAASKGKPILLATGASDVSEVQRAVHAVRRHNVPMCLFQCNTNYTGNIENFQHVHLNVLHLYSTLFPDCVLGLSDHTPGHAAVLGAVALGARAIEKHFTDDSRREGPDHGFSLDPRTWREMVSRTRELEAALGSTEKFVADNERETVVLQRRCLRAASDLAAGQPLRPENIESLRPAPPDSLPPFVLSEVIGHALRRPLARGDCLRWIDLE